MPAGRRAYFREYRARNKDRIRNRDRVYRMRNRDRILRLQESDTILRRYGITIREREYLRYAQHDLCACCGEHKPLQIDHDHAIGDGKREAIRGLVCNACNALVGEVENGTLTGAAWRHPSRSRYGRDLAADLRMVRRYLRHPNPFEE